MRDHVLETPGVTVAALEAERVAALSNATNPPAAAVHRVCDALGRAPPKGVRSRITPDVLKLQQIVYDRNNRRQQA